MYTNTEEQGFKDDDDDASSPDDDIDAPIQGRLLDASLSKSLHLGQRGTLITIRTGLKFLKSLTYIHIMHKSNLLSVLVTRAPRGD